MSEARLEYKMLDDPTLGIAVGLKLLLQYLEPQFRRPNHRRAKDLLLVGAQTIIQGYVDLLCDLARDSLVGAQGWRAELADLWDFLMSPRTAGEVYDRVDAALGAIVGDQDWWRVQAVKREVGYRQQTSHEAKEVLTHA